VARKQGAYDEALAYYEESFAIAEEVGGRWGVALMLGNLGMVCVDQGRDGAAWDYLRRALDCSLAIQAMTVMLATLGIIARLQERSGQLGRAAELLGLVLGHPASSIEIEADTRALLATLREKLPPEQLEAAMARGAQLELEATVVEILETQ